MQSNHMKLSFRIVLLMLRDVKLRYIKTNIIIRKLDKYVALVHQKEYKLTYES